MIERLHVSDFKGIRDLEVSLRPLTVFVGANGVGKTTLLEAAYVIGLFLRGVVMVFEERHHEGRWNENDLIRNGADEAHVSVSTSSGSGAMHLRRTDTTAFALPAADLQKLEPHLGEVSRYPVRDPHG